MTLVTFCVLFTFLSLFQWNYNLDSRLCPSVFKMEPACRKDKQKQQTPTRGDRTKQKSAQQELKQRQRAEVTVTLPLHPHILMSIHIHRYDWFVPGNPASYDGNSVMTCASVEPSVQSHMIDMISHSFTCI